MSVDSNISVRVKYTLYIVIWEGEGEKGLIRIPGNMDLYLIPLSC